MNSDSPQASIPTVQRIVSILWPSFIMAGIATAVFFAFFDPLDLLSCDGAPPFTRMGAYSIGFFLFWLLTAGSSAATVYFLRPCDLVNPREKQTG